MKSRLLAMSMAACILFTGTVLPVGAAQAIPVFDASNYAQNVLTAARTLQQINNQIQELQNQATMLTNMGRHLQRLDYSSLGEITRSMQRIGTLMTQAEGIAFDLASTDDVLRRQFPASFDTTLSANDIIAQARARYQASMQGYRQTMRVQSQVVENIEADATLLAELVTQSQSAGGSLQVGQATNQLIALSARQQLQIQQMMAAQYRADALERAREQQAMEGAREQSRRFLGSHTLYTRR
ncbi:MAG: P-type conjugative transfer protein TrbJ [Novosphingobium sp.]